MTTTFKLQRKNLGFFVEQYKDKQIYLASPFSAKSELLRYEREWDVSRIGFNLMKLGYTIFCPITQSSRLQEVAEDHLTHAQWMRHDYVFLSNSSAIFIATLHGWKESKGVKLEIEYGLKHKIPIHLVIDPAEITDALSEDFTLEEVLNAI